MQTLNLNSVINTLPYFIQGGGRGGFPFFDEQPGNGNGNPPPFGEPAASIDANLWILFIIGFALILIVNTKKSHWIKFKNEFMEWSKACPNETKW
jgi:hypothetical protein